jgi:hypothetical protein
MKATAFSSQSVTTFADAVVMGVKRHAASNNHALLRVMAVLRDVGNLWPRLRAGIGRNEAPAGEPAHAEHGGFSPLSRRLVYHRLRLPHASQQVLGVDLNCSESSRPPLPVAPPHSATASQRVVGDSKNTIILARSSADVSPPYGFMLLPGTISSGFAMNRSSFCLSHTKSAPFMALE